MGLFSLDNPQDAIPQDSGRAPSPLHAYIGDARFEGASGESIPNFETFQFDFALLGEVEGTEGMRYQHVEWLPDSESKAKNMAKRIVYILSYFVPMKEGETKVEQATRIGQMIDANDFDTFKTKVVNLVNALKSKGLLNKTVKVKLLPSVYNGKTRPPQFPNYIGFMTDEDSDRELRFSNQEKVTIEKYEAALKQQPTDMGGSSSGDSTAAAAPSEDDFDF